MPKRESILLDVFDKTVCKGDKVVLLVKNYGFRGIDSCYLRPCIYQGKCQYGHEFYDIRNRHMCRHAYRDPQVVKVSKKGGK